MHLFIECVLRRNVQLSYEKHGGGNKNVICQGREVCPCVYPPPLSNAFVEFVQGGVPDRLVLFWTHFKSQVGALSADSDVSSCVSFD